MQVFLNGKPLEVCDGVSLSQVAEKCMPDADLWIYNGYQTQEDRTLAPGDEIVLIRKGVMPAPDVLEHMMAARHTPKVYEKVKNARVAVAGLGGLGSHIAMMLARTGVGELFLVDFDLVEPSNLNRQNYGIRHLGMAKTQAMAEQIREVNPYITVRVKQCRVTQDNAAELFGGYPIVCEAFDRPETKAAFINTLLEHCPLCTIVAASGMAGCQTANSIRTQKRFSRLYVCGDGETGTQPGCGLMAPRVTACAAHQANMVLRLALGIEEA